MRTCAARPAPPCPVWVTTAAGQYTTRQPAARARAAQRDQALTPGDLAPREPEAGRIVAREHLGPDGGDPLVGAKRLASGRRCARAHARVVVEDEHHLRACGERGTDAQVGAARVTQVLG